MARANEGTDASGATTRDRELRARGRRTMRRLLDAGIAVFARKGFYATRVDDIVKAAHTSHGTFYLYFSSKDDLFRALTEDVADQMAELVDALGPVTPDEAGRLELRTWLGRFTEIYDRCGPVIGAWTEAETEGSEVGRIGTGVLAGFTLALGQQIAAAVDDLDPAVASMALVAMIERYHYYTLGGMVPADGDGALDALTAITHAGLFGARATATVG